MGQNGHADVDLREYVTEMARELTERVGHQREVLLKYLDERQPQGQAIDYCPLIDCSPRQKYRAALLEAIRVIEETRRSFKSRQLEELRKRLEGVLADDAGRKL
ncbi:MAG TPA: hypothetical protein VJV74_17280 [Terriglobia bacterium]|nr:hypothetical protein [Terriglobia bacterium]